MVDLQRQIDEQALRIDNLTRVVRDSVKSSTQVKQKDAEGNVEYVSAYNACECIKP